MPGDALLSSQKSTNDRASSIGPQRRARLGAILFPGLAARLAERAFLSPGRHAPSESARAILATGYRFNVPFESGRLAAWSWGDGPTVFLVHGWGGHAGRMTSFVQPLVTAGYSVVAFDGPGHGESDGKQSSVVELSRALRTVTEWTAAADQVRGHAGAIGHSIGGVAIALAIHGGLVVKRAVFLGAPADLETPAREFAAEQGLTPEAVARMQRRIEARFGIQWRDLAVPRLAPRTPLPLLVVHDTTDQTVPVADAAAITATWPDAERLTTTGLGHHRILEEREVVRRAVEFLGRHAGRRTMERSSGSLAGAA